MKNVKKNVQVFESFSVNIYMSGLDFVSNIEKRLSELGIRKTQMLNTLNIPKSAMNNWATNNNIPRGDIVYSIAQYLNVSVEYLLTGKEQEIPQEVLNLAKDINSLRPAFQNVIRTNIEQFKAMN